MAARSGVGVSLARTPDHRALFNEGPSRVVLVVDPECLTEVLAACDEAEVPAARIGLATGQRFVVKDLLDLSLEEVTAAFKRPLPEALGAGTTNR
jgi:phosphoribosylformylglycinamidine (FGAM) synthase-like enzyme